MLSVICWMFGKKGVYQWHEWFYFGMKIYWLLCTNHYIQCKYCETQWLCVTWFRSANWKHSAALQISQICGNYPLMYIYLILFLFSSTWNDIYTNIMIQNNSFVMSSLGKTLSEFLLKSIFILVILANLSLFLFLFYLHLRPSNSFFPNFSGEVSRIRTQHTYEQDIWMFSALFIYIYIYTYMCVYL